MYEFDCKTIKGISARWKKWVRRLEETVFAAQDITDPLQKRRKLLDEGGEALHDICDIILKDNVEGQEYEHLIRELTKHFEQIETSVLTAYICKERFSKQFKYPQPLGKGGYGRVSKVENILDHQCYAVKEVHFRECSEKVVERKLQEVKLLAKLSDRSPPHIVRYYSAWVESDPNPPDFSTSGSQSLSHPSLLSSFSAAYVDTGVESNCDSPPPNPPDSGTSGSQRNSPRRAGVDSGVETNRYSPTPNPPDSSTSGSQSFSDSKDCSKCQSGNWCKPFLLYIQMERCDRTLSDWLKKRNQKCQESDDVYSVVDVAENELIMEQLLQGLAFIHAMDIIHRDVKPENIFMNDVTMNNDKSYDVKFGDFGLTRDTSVPKPALTHTHAESDLNLPAPSNFTGEHETDQADTKPVYTKGIGTTYYAAPEQLDTKSKENYDHKADMYSLGVVLYELYQPFTSSMERTHLISDLRRQKEDVVAKFEKKWPNVARLILELLSEPATRPSASELLERTEQQRMQNDRKYKDQVRSLATGIESLEVKDSDQKVELLKSQAREVLKTIAHNG